MEGNSKTGDKKFNLWREKMPHREFSHLIGCININSIFDMFQGLVQVARSGRSEETVACICLQEEKREGRRKGDTGCKRVAHTAEEWRRKIERERWLNISFRF